MANEIGRPDFSDVQAGGEIHRAGCTARGGFQRCAVVSQFHRRRGHHYAVAAGDNLTKIAKRLYGNANAWKQVLDANLDQLSDPDRIRVGQVLKIPALS